jgi:hypothetical protein
VGKAWRRRRRKRSRGLGFLAKAVAAAWGKLRAQGRPRRLGMQAQNAARAGRRRTAAGLGLESKPGSGKGKVPTRGTRLPTRGEGKGEEAGRAGGLGRGRESRPRAGERRKEASWASTHG